MVGHRKHQPPHCWERATQSEADVNAYDFKRTISEGSYGDVHMCIHRLSGERVAIKRFKTAHLDPQVWRLAMREARVLQQLPRHPNIIELRRAVCSQASGRLYFVFEYMERSLLEEVQLSPGGVLPGAQLRSVAWQLLQALAHCHEHRVIHRDVKPANVLVSSPPCGPAATEVGGISSGGSPHGYAASGLRVKLCDFGFARWTPVSASDMAAGFPAAGGSSTSGRRQDQGLPSPYVVTRWYRAPEVLVEHTYGLPVDIWSYGCTLAELATGEPLFPGSSSLDQLWRITRCLGPLPEAMVAQLRPDSQRRRVAIEPDRGRTLAQLIKSSDPLLLELIAACLTLDPRRRPTAAQLLDMPYFSSLQQGASRGLPRAPAGPSSKTIQVTAMAADGLHLSPDSSKAVCTDPTAMAVRAQQLMLANASAPGGAHWLPEPGQLTRGEARWSVLDEVREPEVPLPRHTSSGAGQQRAVEQPTDWCAPQSALTGLSSLRTPTDWLQSCPQIMSGRSPAAAGFPATPRSPCTDLQAPSRRYHTTQAATGPQPSHQEQALPPYRQPCQRAAKPHPPPSQPSRAPGSQPPQLLARRVRHRSATESQVMPIVQTAPPPVAVGGGERGNAERACPGVLVAPMSGAADMAHVLRAEQAVTGQCDGKFPGSCVSPVYGRSVTQVGCDRLEGAGVVSGGTSIRRRADSPLGPNRPVGHAPAPPQIGSMLKAHLGDSYTDGAVAGSTEDWSQPRHFRHFASTITSTGPLYTGASSAAAPGPVTIVARGAAEDLIGPIQDLGKDVLWQDSLLPPPSPLAKGNMYSPPASALRPHQDASSDFETVLYAILPGHMMADGELLSQTPTVMSTLVSSGGVHQAADAALGSGRVGAALPEARSSTRAGDALRPSRIQSGLSRVTTALYEVGPSGCEASWTGSVDGPIYVLSGPLPPRDGTPLRSGEARTAAASFRCASSNADRPNAGPAVPWEDDPSNALTSILHSLRVADGHAEGGPAGKGLRALTAGSRPVHSLRQGSAMAAAPTAAAAGAPAASGGSCGKLAGATVASGVWNVGRNMTQGSVLPRQQQTGYSESSRRILVKAECASDAARYQQHYQQHQQQGVLPDLRGASKSCNGTATGGGGSGGERARAPFDKITGALQAFRQRVRDWRSSGASRGA